MGTTSDNDISFVTLCCSTITFGVDYLGTIDFCTNTSTLSLYTVPGDLLITTELELLLLSKVLKTSLSSVPMDTPLKVRMQAVYLYPEIFSCSTHSAHTCSLHFFVHHTEAMQGCICEFLSVPSQSHWPEMEHSEYLLLSIKLI